MQTLSNDLSVTQPFIGRISQQPNLTGFFSIFEDALKATDKAATEKSRTATFSLLKNIGWSVGIISRDCYIRSKDMSILAPGDMSGIKK